MPRAASGNERVIGHASALRRGGLARRREASWAQAGARTWSPSLSSSSGTRVARPRSARVLVSLLWSLGAIMLDGERVRRRGPERAGSGHLLDDVSLTSQRFSSLPHAITGSCRCSDRRSSTGDGKNGRSPSAGSTSVWDEVNPPKENLPLQPLRVDPGAQCLEATHASHPPSARCATAVLGETRRARSTSSSSTVAAWLLACLVVVGASLAGPQAA